MKSIRRILWFIILTIVTQIGGVVFIINLFVSKKIFGKLKRYWLKRQTMFIALYLLVSFLVVPPLAKFKNRKPLPFLKITTLQPQNWLIPLCNRHYVHKDLYEVISAVANDFNKQSSDKAGSLKLNYLDANFPFIDGFPLLPHLSHNDGLKLDLAFRYQTKGEQPPMNKTVSLFGYGVYEGPISGEVDQTAICKETSWRYDMTKYVGIPKNGWLTFDGWETKRLVELLAAANMSKVFIEPHLKQRLELTSPKIRFHGCHAVRHDDHIHVQVL